MLHLTPVGCDLPLVKAVSLLDDAIGEDLEVPLIMRFPPLHYIPSVKIELVPNVHDVIVQLRSDVDHSGCRPTSLCVQRPGGHDQV